MRGILSKQSCTRLLVLLACFALSVAAGRAFADCAKECELMLCRSFGPVEESENPGFKCFHYTKEHAPPISGANFPNVTSRDPQGGVHDPTGAQLDRWVCPDDCNPECIDDPAEATACDINQGCEKHPSSPIDQMQCEPSPVT